MRTILSKSVSVILLEEASWPYWNQEMVGDWQVTCQEPSTRQVCWRIRKRETSMSDLGHSLLSWLLKETPRHFSCMCHLLWSWSWESSSVRRLYIADRSKWKLCWRCISAFEVLSYHARCFFCLTSSYFWGNHLLWLRDMAQKLEQGRERTSASLT